MIISFHGLSCFEIATKTSSGEATLLTNPYDNETGLRLPKTLSPDLVVVSHDSSDANNLEGLQNKPFAVSTPGEFEVKGIFIYSIAAPLVEKGMNNHRIFRIEVEDIHLVHLGALNRALKASELEEIGNVDILMIPVGGGRVLTPKLAVEVIEQLEPKIVIPMFYGVSGLKESLGEVEAFCKVMGVPKNETANKLKITKRDLPEEEDMLVTVLERA